LAWSSQSLLPSPISLSAIFSIFFFFSRNSFYFLLGLKSAPAVLIKDPDLSAAIPSSPPLSFSSSFASKS
jgi:hypothetical protein